MRAQRRTWTIGGVGLVVCGVFGMLQSALLGVPGGYVLAITADVVYAASVLLFAIGTTWEASVVARRPPGVTALAVVALWPLVDQLVVRLLPQDVSSIGVFTTYGYVALLVQTSAALLAATQIAGAGVVPRPWCWAPLWVLGLQAFAWAAPQIVVVSAGSGAIQTWSGPFILLGTVSGLAGTLGFGILALVLAARQRPGSVDVFRSDGASTA